MGDSGMDNRFVTLGMIVIVVSIGFLVYGVVTGEPVITGSALAMVILGMVFTAIGLTYRDPLTGLLRVYSGILSTGLVKIYEDLGLLEESATRACFNGNLVHIVFSRKPVECEGIKPGVGVKSGVPYISLAGEPLSTGGEDLDTAIMRSGLAQYAVVMREGDTVTVDLRGTPFPGEPVGRRPLNLYQVIVPFLAASHYSSNIEVVEEDLGDDYYRAVLRVVGH